MVSKIRLLTQLAFFTLSILAFFGPVSHNIISFYHSFQVFPSISQIAWLVKPPFFFITLLMLVVPFVIGRLYCSFLCPLGFIQDLVTRAASFLRINKGGASSPIFVRLGLLFFCLASLIMASSHFHFFDHSAYINRIYASGAFCAGLNKFSSAVALGLLCFIVIVVAPARWFCNTICPTGTLFMLAHRHAIFRFAIQNSCNGCHRCDPVCPAGCIVSEKIDSSRCIQCLQCIEACPSSAITLGRFQKPIVTGRREFLRGLRYSLTGIVMAIVGNRVFRPTSAKKAVVPPGAKSAEQFLDRCTGCGACLPKCPTRVLDARGLEDGISEFAKVKMNFNRGYCAYECNACLTVCPTGALSFLPLKPKQMVKIGSSRLNKELCIPYVKKQDCAACHEQCPTGAITMVKDGSIFVPQTNDDYCIGCGSCQYACPVQPLQAILVEARDIHTIAYNPKQHGPNAVKLKSTSSQIGGGFPF